MAPEVLSCKWRVRLNAIPDETTSRMGVHGQQERDEKVVRVPERFVALLPYLRVRRGEHEQHAKQHDMARNTTGLHVMNLHSGFSSHQRTLDVEEVHVVRCYVNNSPEEHGVSDLAMEPLAFVQR